MYNVPWYSPMSSKYECHISSVKYLQWHQNVLPCQNIRKSVFVLLSKLILHTTGPALLECGINLSKPLLDYLQVILKPMKENSLSWSQLTWFHTTVSGPVNSSFYADPGPDASIQILIILSVSAEWSNLSPLSSRVACSGQGQTAGLWDVIRADLGYKVDPPVYCL